MEIARSYGMLELSPLSWMNAGLRRSALLLAKAWVSEKDLARYVRGRDFRNELAVIELVSELPNVEIKTIASTRGYDRIPEYRGRRIAVRECR